jgi:hypothetical protein
MHLDLETDDIEAEVQRLEALGATRYDHQQERGFDFWVLRDPWGNEFCVLHPNFPELLARRRHGSPSGGSIGKADSRERPGTRPTSGPRGGSLVLPPRPGWRDLAGRCWHARPQPQALHQPTRHPSRARSAVDPIGPTSLALSLAPGLSRHGRRLPSPGSKGRADRPARHSGGMQHDRGKRELRRQPHRRPGGPLHRGRHC